MTEWLAGLLLVLAAVPIWGLMYVGWRRRVRRQTDVAEPATAPPGDDVGDVVLPATDGVYVSTVRRGDWLDRVVAHGLGMRGDATLVAGSAGVWWQRAGARSVFVPAADVLAVGRTRGQAGKFTLEEGIVVVSWRSGDAELDTGFRPRARDDVAAVEQALARVVGDEAAA